ncbi:MAG: hypothetical protein HYS44_00720 [Candidatus Niyogibacteria bacterium]|nr:hypothetical protein [Candidatus Niyogibacteria bacterium]
MNGEIILPPSELPQPQPPAPQPPQTPPPAPPAPSGPVLMTPSGPASAPKPSSIRTMVGDTEKALKSGELSGASALTRGGTLTRVGGYTGEEPRHRWVLWLSLAVGAFVIVGGGLFFWFTIQGTPGTPAITAPKPAIPATQSEIVRLTGLDPFRPLAEAGRAAFFNEWNVLYKKPLLPAEFRAVSVFNTQTSAFLTAQEFFSLLSVPAPALLTGGLRGTATLGAIRTARGIETVFIVSIRSFSEALAGMLEWERSLPGAFAPLLAPDIPLERGSETFTDRIISNHDVRSLKNTAGEPILLYTIFNRQTLIIAQSPEALEVILRQLSFFPTP